MTERIKTVIILTSIINYSKKLEKTEYMTERENKRDYSEPDNRDIIGLKDYQIKIIEEQNDHPQMEELDQPEEMTEDTTGKVSPLVTDFREAKIRLHPGSGFYDAQERMRRYLHRMDADQLLYNFRSAAGLPVKDAEPMFGWDAPECLLRGHTTGHFLSALAHCYHSCADETAKEKAEYMIEALRECQEAFPKNKGTGQGFLSGYLEEQFDLLEEYTPYPQIWAPYYTLHKLFAGLLDCYELLGNSLALKIAEDLGDWTCRRLSRLPKDQRNRMWSMYIAGEFGGMNEVMARLFQITGEERYLECAAMFDNDRLFAPLLLGKDALGGMHANQHIPQVIGALEMYMAGAGKRYRTIAERFWNYVVSGHAYAPGGVGESEMFHDRGKIGTLLTEKTQETCASYNMLKLTKGLYQLDPKASYMDYYERTLVNHILAVQEKEETGESTYFWPLAPGTRRIFEPENSCCHGTGMESPFRFRDAIYFQDGDTVYVNLYLPCTLEMPDGRLQIRQTQAEKDPEQIKIQVKGKIRTLALRKPGWAKEDLEICVQGNQADPIVDESGYIRIQADFEAGVEINVRFPYHPGLIRTPDKPELAAVQAGPYILAALSEEQEALQVPVDEENVETLLQRAEEGVEYFLGDIRFIPLYRIDQERYHVYLHTEK